jgi:DNA mismatch endonuclease (patch repair protein)
VTDIVDKATRSKMMSGIKSKNTKIELLIRSVLHRNGFRFRLHKKDLPGKPDLYLAKYKVAIFVHGCFWHLHGCPLSRMPKTRKEFWAEKLGKNKERDKKQINELVARGLRVLTVWECALRNKSAQQLDEVFDEMIFWIDDGNSTLEISGKN